MEMTIEDIKQALSTYLLATISDPRLAKTNRELLQNVAFFIAPAAAKRHQAEEGGLALHTLQVIDIALAMTKSKFITASRSVLFSAALWHDYGKIWDYQPVQGAPRGIGYTRHRWTIRHLPRSYAEFVTTARQNKVDDMTIEEIGHCILSHHGPGNGPVDPLTIEAGILHAADTISGIYLDAPHIFRDPPESWKDAPIRF
jgi:23S rRNA maturation-related 3'-5' exoribonuclease YhaM